MSNKGFAETYKIWSGWGTTWQFRALVYGQTHATLQLYSQFDWSDHKISPRFMEVRSKAHFGGLGLGASGGFCYGIAWNIADPKQIESCGGLNIDYSFAVTANLSGPIKEIIKMMGKEGIKKTTQYVGKNIATWAAKKASEEAFDNIFKNSKDLITSKTGQPMFIIIPISAGLEASLGLASQSNEVWVVNRRLYQ